MPSWIDGTLYPDRAIPETLESLADRVDFLVRLCGAWDFGILPRPETLRVICRPDWREPIDACRLLTSPAYHLLRQWHALDTLPYLGDWMPHIRDDPNLQYI